MTWRHPWAERRLKPHAPTRATNLSSKPSSTGDRCRGVPIPARPGTSHRVQAVPPGITATAAAPLLAIARAGSTAGEREVDGGVVGVCLTSTDYG